MSRVTPRSERAPLLFLHGGFCGPEIWRLVAEWFAGRGWTVATPSLAGSPSSGSARLRDRIAAARDAADALGAAPVVIGHSLGGLVAQHLAAERRLAGMALIGSPGPFGAAPSFWRLSLLRRKALAALMLTQAGAGSLLGLAAARATLFGDETPDDWIRAHAPLPSPESPLVLFDAMTWDLPPWMFARGTPTLALLGSDDAFIPGSDLLALGFAYGAQIETLEGMAHGAPIDPRWRRVAWRIDAWLDEVVAKGRRPEIVEQSGPTRR